MQEDNSLAEKILSDVEYLINSDDQLKEFSIIPVPENEKNKSPVLYEEHNLGLEMWCVKHVYRYSHSYLLKIRDQLRKNRLSQSQIVKVNKLLIGVILIQADVSTFWNMRRELIEYEFINLDKELLLTRLVLSHKSKSNEAFSHRRWVIKRLLKNTSDSDIQSARVFLENELLVTEMACRKTQNNYHAWTHRLWAIKNITPSLLPQIVIRELDFSFHWIFFNVSEHAGFHYRQRLFAFMKTCNTQDVYFNMHKNYIEKYLNLSNTSNSLVIANSLFGQKSVTTKRSKVYQDYLYALLFELLNTLDKLNKSFPGHESVWYHRRFIIHSLLQSTYEYFGINWQSNVKIDDSNITKDVNIVYSDCSNSLMDGKFQENGEKYPKQFKSEPVLVENSGVYKLLLKIEAEFINTNSSSNNKSVQIELCKRHEKWLRLILGISLNE